VNRRKNQAPAIRGYALHVSFLTERFDRHSTCIIRGTNEQVTCRFTIQVTDATRSNGSQSFGITVSGPSGGGEAFTFLG